MSSWLSNSIPQPVQLTLAATLGALTTAGMMIYTFSLHQRIATEDLKASIPDITEKYRAQSLTEMGIPRMHHTKIDDEDERAAKIASRARRGNYDEELILEQLARNRVFLKDDGLRKVRDAFVIVVGLGGVGSHCVAALARSGVSKIRVVDFDQVTLSSLNRHALATLADVGTAKVICVQKRLEQICPWVRIDCRNELFSSNAAPRLLGEWSLELLDSDYDGMEPDFVVDAIDNIDSKVALLHYCALHSIPVISSMGAGCKSDPTRIQVGDISTSIEDPLSKSTRRRLRIMGISDGIPVVFSTEKPGPGKAELLPVAEAEVEKGNVGSLGVLPDFRVRILPVLGTMPAVFGYTLANYILCSIAGYPMEYRVGDRGREKMYEGVLSALQGMEERLVRSVEGQTAVGLRLPVSREDVGYLIEEVFRGKSVVSGLSNRLALVRWRKPAFGFRGHLVYEEEGQKSIDLKLHDLVLMTKEEAQRHEREVLIAGIKPEEFYDQDVLATVWKRLEEEKAFQRYR